jgi:hypothetical protein
MTPGTSCLATIMLSLWDEDILCAEALIKLALMGFQPWEPQNEFPGKPWAKLSWPFGPYDRR